MADMGIDTEDRSHQMQLTYVHTHKVIKWLILSTVNPKISKMEEAYTYSLSFVSSIRKSKNISSMDYVYTFFFLLRISKLKTINSMEKAYT